MTHLNSSFLYNLSRTVPDMITRRFIVGGSDYSNYVTRWPTIRRTYDNIAPVTATVNLANQEGTFNFFRIDKTKMIADAYFYVEAYENRLVDVYSQNMFFLSANMVNSDYWRPGSRVTRTDSTAETLAPNSTYTAMMMLSTSDGGSNEKYVLTIESADTAGARVTPLYSGQQYTLSAFFKKRDVGFGYFNFSNNDGRAFLRIFDIENGAIAGASGVTLATTSGVEAWPGNWFRCWTRFDSSSGAGAAQSVRVEFGMTVNSGNSVSAVASGQGLYLWGPQLTITSTPVNYTPSYSLQVNPPSLGQNLAWFSEQLDVTSYDASTAWRHIDCTVTANYFKSPISCNTAAELWVGNSGFLSAQITQNINTVVDSGAYNAFTIYAKLRDDITSLQNTKLSMRESGGTQTEFDLRVGSVTNLGWATALVESAGSGWWRVTACSTRGGNYNMGLIMSPLVGVLNGTHGYGVFGAMRYVSSAGLVSAPPYLQTTDTSISTGTAFNLFQACAVNTLTHVGSYEVFVGRVSRVKYDEGNVSISITDKLKPLSERVMGSTDVPVSYLGSNYLPSDLAWWAITSYGNLSNVQSTSNPDIDYATYQEWAAVFSGDSVFVQARFEGTKVTSALRKIQRMTDSAIFLKNNKLSFRRFTIANSEFYNLTDDNIVGMDLEIDETKIINRQYVYGNYDVSSDIFAITVFIQDSASVNSFGLREEIEKDQSIWYTSSANAQNLAERIIFLRGKPFENAGVDATLGGLLYEIGDMITVTDSITGLSSAPFRIFDKGFNMDTCLVSFASTTNQSFLAFILDQSLLDGPAVLT